MPLLTGSTFFLLQRRRPSSYDRFGGDMVTEKEYQGQPRERREPEGRPDGAVSVSGEERRRFERVFVDLEVDYRCEDTFLFAYIRDISAMGIFVRTLSPESPGTRLNLRFSPPGAEEPLELEGVVIWINPYRPGNQENLNPGMGIQFVDLTPEQREQLTDLIRTFAYLGDDDGGDGDEAFVAPGEEGSNSSTASASGEGKT
ncbi:MAG: TIGR02266 family protein [Pseudomonadota bacterium]